MLGFDRLDGAVRRAVRHSVWEHFRVCMYVCTVFQRAHRLAAAEAAASSAAPRLLRLRVTEPGVYLMVSHLLWTSREGGDSNDSE